MIVWKCLKISTKCDSMFLKINLMIFQHPGAWAATAAQSQNFFNATLHRFSWRFFDCASFAQWAASLSFILNELWSFFKKVQKWTFVRKILCVDDRNTQTWHLVALKICYLYKPKATYFELKQTIYQVF